MADSLGKLASRIDAIKAGDLIDVSGLAKTAGIALPIVISKYVMADCVQWGAVDTARTKIIESAAGRFWNLFVALRHAIRTNRVGCSELEFNLTRTPRDGSATEGLARIKVVVDMNENKRPTITLRLAHELDTETL